MQTSPFFTIVTPSYNQGKFLESSITSVLSQRNVSFEYFVLDGGSSDNSVEIIQKYKKHIQYSVSQADGGCAHALNTGLSMASGKYFMYLNSDDYLIENSLEKVLYFIQNSKYSDVYLGHGIQRDEIKSLEYPAYSSRFTLKGYLRGRASIFQQGTIFKTESIKNRFRFNVFNNSCWDGEFLVDLALGGLLFQRMPLYMKIGVFRLHEESISGSGSRLASYIEQLDRIKKRIILTRPELANVSMRGGLLRDCIFDSELIFSRLISRIIKKKIIL